MLPSLGNVHWILYPFIKTFKIIGSKLCCRKGRDENNVKDKVE
jgi:hypothetical protein